MRRRLACSCLWALMLGWLCVAAAASPRPEPLANLFIETWTTRDGLPHNLVLDLAQTPDDYLWMATWEGVVRFNGLEFAVIDRSNLAVLSDNGIRALHIGPSGTLWVATARGGIVRQPAGGGAFVAEDIGLEDAQIMSVVEQADGTLWVLTEDAGLDRYTPGQPTRRFEADQGLPSNVAYDMALDLEGRMLVATGAGLGVVDGDHAFGVAAAQGLPRGPVLSVQAAPDGRIYAGTENGVYSASADLMFSPVHPGLAREAAQTLFVDLDGTLWVGTIAGGLYRVSDGMLDRLGVEDGLPNGRVASILRDHEQSLWVSTNGGLVRLRQAPFRTYARQAGLVDDYVRTILEHDDGSTWVGTSAGLSRFRDGRFETMNERLGLPGTSILSLAPGRDGALWVGTYYNGVAKVVNDRVVQVLGEAQGLPSNSIRTIVETPDGVVWVGTSRGLARVDSAGVRRFGLDDGLPRELVIAMHLDQRGQLWVGTTRGMARVEGDTLVSIDLAGYGGAHRVFGFGEEADGTLWLATDRGLLRQRDGRYVHVGAPHGLPYDSLFAELVDGVGGLWVSSNRGVLRIDQTQANAAADGSEIRLDIERFGEADGMASPQANGGSWPSAIRRRDGSLWFATAQGVAAVLPDQRRSTVAEPPRVVIERVRLDDAEVPASPVLTLPAGARRFEVSFAGLTFLQTRQLRYRYRLEGFDPGWVDSGSARSAQFTNLPAGKFRFRVTAAQPGGAWSTREAAFDVVVTPRLWEHEAFRPLAALALLLVAYAVYRWRVRQLHADGQRLASLVDVRTAELRGQAERLQAADVEKSALLAELKRQSDAFSRQAREDQLTGLANRRAFDEALAREFARAQRSGRALSLALLDVDHFKRVNDAYSHSAGDALLKALATIMLRHSREVDMVARWGGEEFALLFPDTALSDAVRICERLRDEIAALEAQDIAPGLRVTVSIGLATHTGMTHHERMLIRADERLYAAKQAGRNRVMG